MKPSLLPLLLLTTTLITATQAELCKDNQALGLNQEFKEECYSCDPHCSTCLLMAENKPQCFYCEDGFFLKLTAKGKGQCKPCVEGCRVCIGPETADCEQMDDFYYYDEGLEKLEKCDQSCAKCKDKDHCLKCADGFYPEVEEQELKEGVDQADAETPDDLKNNENR